MLLLSGLQCAGDIRTDSVGICCDIINTTRFVGGRQAVCGVR